MNGAAQHREGDIALIAGRGRLPQLLAGALAAGGDGAPPVYALEGQVPDLPCAVHPFRAETLGSLIAELAGKGLTRICLAGAIHRPALDPARVDAATAPLVPRMIAALGRGDDGALRMAAQFFEEAGIAVVGADAILPDLLPEAGVPTRVEPDQAVREDAVRGMEALDLIGRADIGQGCVVARRQILAVEAMPGTDAMLASLRERSGHLPAGGILCKAPKPGQDRRIDLPTIGPETVKNAAAAGLSGVVIAAGGVLMLDAEAAIAEADRQRLFIWIREP